MHTTDASNEQPLPGSFCDLLNLLLGLIEVAQVLGAARLLEQQLGFCRHRSIRCDETSKACKIVCATQLSLIERAAGSWHPSSGLTQSVHRMQQASLRLQKLTRKPLSNWRPMGAFP